MVKASGFIDNIPEQSEIFIRGLPSLPSHIITSISNISQMIDQWRDFRAQHFHTMIEPLAQMYSLHDNRLVTDLTS